MLAVLLALVPWRSFLSGGVPVGRDLCLYFYPMKVHLAEALRSAEVPWLDPYRWGGTPLLALPGAQAFYPGNVLFVLLSPGTAMKSWIAFHLALGTAGFALLALRLGLPAGAAAFGAVAFSLSGVTLSVQAFPTAAATLAWTPWLAAAVAGAVRRPGRKAAARLAVVSGVFLSTMNPEQVFSGGLFALALGVAQWRAGDDGAPADAGRGRTGRRIASVAGGALLGAALAAPALLGGVVTALPSVRGPGGGTNEAFAGSGALPATRLVEFLGDGLVADWRRALRGPSGEEYPYYPSLTPGVVALSLAAAGLLAGGKGRGEAAALSLAGILLALGPATPAWTTAVRLLPPLLSVRTPEKYAVLTTLGAAWLGALGAAAIAARLPERARGAFLALACGAILAERGGGALGDITLEPPATLATPPAVLAPVVALASPGQPPPRLFQQDIVLPVPAFDEDVRAADAYTRRSAQAGFGALFGVAYVFDEDYDFSLPREVTEWQKLLGRSLPTGSPLPRTAIRGAGAAATVRTSLLRPGVGVPELRLEPDPLPPYRFASRVVEEGDYGRLFARFLAESADPSCAWVFRETAVGRQRIAGEGRVVSVADRPSALVLEVEVKGPDPGVLQLARLREACREARLDGRPVEVLDATFGFSAVEIPPGRHRLSLRPPTAWLNWGVALCASSLLVLVFLTLRGRRRDAA